MYQVVRLHWSMSEDERESAVANFGTVDVPMPLDTLTEPWQHGPVSGSVIFDGAHPAPSRY